MVTPFSRSHRPLLLELLSIGDIIYSPTAISLDNTQRCVKLPWSKMLALADRAAHFDSIRVMLQDVSFMTLQQWVRISMISARRPPACVVQCKKRTAYPDKADGAGHNTLSVKSPPFSHGLLSRSNLSPHVNFDIMIFIYQLDLLYSFDDDYIC